jgi:flavin-dependent dehydrogenase
MLLAKELAYAGFDVTVGEALEKDAFASKYNWADAIELCILKDAGLPVPFPKGDRWYGEGVIGEGAGPELYYPRRASELGIYAPDYSVHTATDVDFRFVFADRKALQSFQLGQMLEADVELIYGCKVIGLIGSGLEGTLGEICVRGVMVEISGVRRQIDADLVVDATGQEAALRRMLEGAPEISRPFDGNQYGPVYKTHRTCETTQIVADRADADHPPLRNYYRLRTPEGYLFFHPHDDRQFDVGGGAVTMEQAKKNADEVIAKLPGVLPGATGEGAEKNIKALPPDAIVADGFLVVGHAAAQVHPTHGCGVSTAYMGALLAAQIIKRARDFSIGTLWEYAHRWMSTMGAHFAALFPRLKNLETHEIVFLIEQGIINGETLSNDYNGNYLPPNVNERRRLEDAYGKAPEIIEKWLGLEAASKRSFDHYRDYPSHWSACEFELWRRGRPEQPAGRPGRSPQPETDRR